MKIIKREDGFTLIELLIVIAILGTLAVVVLIALNPLQQLARTRDAGRSSQMTQLGHVLEAYSTTHNGEFPDPASGGFLTLLETAEELENVPDPVANSNCTEGTNVESEICYDAADFEGAVIWTDVEANANKQKCVDAGAAADDARWAYSTVNGRGGLVCDLTFPTDAPLTFVD